jgi:hypothetical protein
MKSPQAKFWVEAELRELRELKENKTWKVVPKIPGKRPISCRWVYNLKYTPEGKLDRYKARLVARGFQQEAGKDYGEIFSPVARLKSFRIWCAVAAIFGLTVTTIDISNAFVHSKLEKVIHMDYPPGHKGLEGNTLLLVKSLYGLKQSGRRWWLALSALLKRLDFVPLLTDICVFKHKKSRFFMSVHVDDVTLVTADENMRKTVLAGMAKVLKLKNFGILKMYLGIQVVHTPGNIFLN